MMTRRRTKKHNQCQCRGCGLIFDAPVPTAFCGPCALQRLQARMAGGRG